MKKIILHLALSLPAFFCASISAQVEKNQIEEGAIYKCVKDSGGTEYLKFSQERWSLDGVNVCAEKRNTNDGHCRLSAQSASVQQNWKASGVTPGSSSWSSQGFSNYQFAYHPRHEAFRLNVTVYSIAGIEEDKSEYGATCHKTVEGDGKPLANYQINF